jgi:serine/threonine protein phosphatase PrpC
MWLLDGHRGAGAARFGAPALSTEIGQAIKSEKLPSDAQISQSFRTVDNQLRKHFKTHPEDAKAGSTVVGLLTAKQSDGTYTAKLVNCGDSRGVVVKSPQDVRLKRRHNSKKLRSLVVESVDHKPCHPKEKARIKAAGGSVRGERPPRIDGDLAVSRGLGDFKYKADRRLPPSAQKVSCEPDIYEVSSLQPGALVVLACDGLWDVMTTEDVTSFVCSRIRGGVDTDLAELASALVRSSLKKKTRDNVTVLIAQIADCVSEAKVSTAPETEFITSVNEANLEGSADVNAEHSLVVHAH